MDKDQTSPLNHFTPTLFQHEDEYLRGHRCLGDTEFFVSPWYAVETAGTFALLVIVPFILMGHNYVRIGRTLFKSLKESVHLKEGIKAE